MESQFRMPSGYAPGQGFPPVSALVPKLQYEPRFVSEPVPAPPPVSEMDSPQGLDGDAMARCPPAGQVH